MLVTTIHQTCDRFSEENFYEPHAITWRITDTHALKSQREGRILHFTKKESPTARWDSSFEHQKEYFLIFYLFFMKNNVWFVEPNIRNVKINGR